MSLGTNTSILNRHKKVEDNIKTVMIAEKPIIVAGLDGGFMDDVLAGSR